MTRQLFFHNLSGRNAPDFSLESFSSFIVHDGIIKEVFKTPCLPPLDYEPIDLQGTIVFPAFSDSHVHFGQTAMTMSGCVFDTVSCLDDVFSLIYQCAKESSFVLGWNLQELQLKEKRLPTVEELDAVCPDAFVFLVRRDMHSAVANSVALRWASSYISDVAAYQGVLRGVNYYQLLYHLPDIMPEQLLADGLNKLEKHCFAKGVLNIHALEGGKGFEQQTILVEEFFNRSKLNSVIYHQSPDPKFVLDKGWNRMGGCLLVDGSFGTRTAALKEEYTDDLGNCGELYLDEVRVSELASIARDNHLQLSLHAIGDRAIDVVARAYLSSSRHAQKPIANRIEHFILPDASSIEMAFQSGAMLAVQPTFDKFWGGSAGLYALRLGEERASMCNPLRTLKNRGFVLAGGSDSPVTPIDPLLGIQSALLHSNTAESLDLNSAIMLYTTAPYQIAAKSGLKGFLESGYVADFVCLKEDPFKISPEKIADIEVIALFGGAQRCV